MPPINQHKIQTLLPFLGVLLCILLLVISFWNHSLKCELGVSAWALVFLVLSIASLAYVYLQVVKATDPKHTESLIQTEVEKERTKILASFETHEEQQADDLLTLQKQADEILPKGTFNQTDKFLDKLLSNLSKHLQLSMGLAYTLSEQGDEYFFSTAYALTHDEPLQSFKPGDNLNGEVARTLETLILNDIPEDYFPIESGLGKSQPKTLIIAPIVHDSTCIAILEIATFSTVDHQAKLIIDEVCQKAAGRLLQIQKS